MLDEPRLRRIWDLAVMAEADPEAMPVFCDAVLEDLPWAMRIRCMQIPFGAACEPRSVKLVRQFDDLIRLHASHTPRLVKDAIAEIPGLAWTARP